MDRAGSSAINAEKAAEILFSECGRKENEGFVGGMQSVSCPADVPLQPWTASCADGGRGDSSEEEIRRSETHWLAAEQKLGRGQCGLGAEAAVDDGAEGMQGELLCASAPWSLSLSPEHPQGASLCGTELGSGFSSPLLSRRSYSPWQEGSSSINSGAEAFENPNEMEGWCGTAGACTLQVNPHNPPPVSTLQHHGLLLPEKRQFLLKLLH